MRRLVARSSVIPAPVEEAPPASVAPAAPVARERAAPPAEPEPAGLASIIKVAERAGRTDLSSKLRANRESIRRTGITVAVVGEFKKGKSTLVNALVNAEVCPADPVYASIAPISVGHGEEFTVTLTYGDGRTETSPLDASALAEVASEAGNDGNHLGLARVDVTLPRRLLAAGLHIVDMPGVGGLDSAVGALNLASLDAADGVVFVTDCTQELTAPELAFLVAARKRCPRTMCVMTKRDLQHNAVALIERNRAHLQRHGLEDVDLLAVSSVLHLVALAQGDSELERESGFATLFDAVHRQVWVPARRTALADAGRQLADLADHVAAPLEAEREALRSPAEAERTLTRLAELEDRVRQVRSASARWQQRLGEGVQDALGDLDHELRDRFRALARVADSRVDAEGSADDLAFEAWLHKATMDEVVAHYDRIRERMTVLSDEVASHFLALDRSAAFSVESDAPSGKLAGLSVSREQSALKDGVLRRLVTTGQGYSSGIVLTSSVLGVFGGTFLLIPALALPIAGLMARRAFVDDRDRRKATRRIELKRMAHRYLDEVGFVVHKDARDSIRTIHRQVREHYLERADRLERTLQQAKAAAEHARQRSGEQAPAEQRSIEQAADAVQSVRRAAERLIAAVPARVA
jgi:hypothetical protein